MLNEFLSPPWEAPIPGTSLPLGTTMLQSLDFDTERYWIWAGVGYLVAYFLVLTLASVWGLEHCQMPPQAPQVGRASAGTHVGSALCQA